MILAYYGDRRDPAYLKSLAALPGSEFPGTYYKDMVAGLGKIGYRWQEECFPVDADGFATGLHKLKRSVLEDHPVIVSLFDPPIGHTVVLVGFDEASQELTFLDPNETAPGLRTIPVEELRVFWREHAIKYRCAVFTSPKP